MIVSLMINILINVFSLSFDNRQRSEQDKTKKFSLFIYPATVQTTVHFKGVVEEGFIGKMHCNFFERKQNVFVEVIFYNKEDMEEYKIKKKDNIFFEIAGKSVLPFFNKLKPVRNICR